MSHSGTEIDLEFKNQNHEIDAVIVMVTESISEAYIITLTNSLISQFGISKRFILVQDCRFTETNINLKPPFKIFSENLSGPEALSELPVEWPLRPLLIHVGENNHSITRNIYALVKVNIRQDKTSLPKSSRYDAVLNHKKSLSFDFSTFCKGKQLRDSLIRRRDSLNILILYDDLSTHVQTIYEHLEAFQKHSSNKVFYATCTKDSTPTVSIDKFDVLIIHFSVRISLEDYLSSAYGNRIRNFKGYKILFIQDEFDTTETSRKWMDFLGFHLVFSIVPSKYLPEVYSPGRYPGTQFVFTMPGFISNALLSTKYIKSLDDRKIEIGYRGRSLPFWYGRFGQEKKWIGEKGKFFFSRKNLTIDIEWEDDKRIYGESWYYFLSNCKTMLGCEGGCNIFDFDGTLRSNIENILKANPQISFEEIEALFLKDKEGHILTNQITPKFFEAIALKVGLVLYEGYYSGVLKPYKHYIPLKKDFSNVDEVVSLVKNKEFLRTMINQTYKDVVKSNKYTYVSFVKHLDKFLRKEISTTYTIKNPIEAPKTKKGFMFWKKQKEDINKANPSKSIYIFWGERKVTFDESLWSVIKNGFQSLKDIFSKIPRSLCF